MYGRSTPGVSPCYESWGFSKIERSHPEGKTPATSADPAERNPSSHGAAVAAGHGWTGGPSPGGTYLAWLKVSPVHAGQGQGAIKQAEPLVRQPARDHETAPKGSGSPVSCA